jgi:hypothetical protein
MHGLWRQSRNDSDYEKAHEWLSENINEADAFDREYEIECLDVEE